MKAEQEATASEQNVSGGERTQRPYPHIVRVLPLAWLFVVGFQVTRLEGQVTRYKTAAENAEKVEDELKAEKRKLQREVAVIFAPAVVDMLAGCFSDQVTTKATQKPTVVAFNDLEKRSSFLRLYGERSSRESRRPKSPKIVLMFTGSSTFKWRIDFTCLLSLSTSTVALSTGQSGRT